MHKKEDKIFVEKHCLAHYKIFWCWEKV